MDRIECAWRPHIAPTSLHRNRPIRVSFGGDPCAVDAGLHRAYIEAPNRAFRPLRMAFYAHG